MASGATRVLDFVLAHEDPDTHWCAASLAEIARGCDLDERKDNGIRNLKRTLDKLVAWNMLVEFRRPGQPRLLSRSQATQRHFPDDTRRSALNLSRRSPAMPEVVVMGRRSR